MDTRDTPSLAPIMERRNGHISGCMCERCIYFRQLRKRRLGIKMAEQGKRRPSSNAVKRANDFLKPR